jgi:hypothetical protein
MFISLQFRLELKKEDKEKLIKLMRCLASSEGSPPLPYSWTKIPFSEAHIGGGAWDRMRSRLVPLEVGFFRTASAFNSF